MNIRGNATREIKILKENNYYNLINGYKHLFLDYNKMNQSNHREDIFKNGTKPSELYNVMQYDNNMRSIFLQYLLYIEEKLSMLLFKLLRKIIMKIYIKNLSI